MFTLNIAAATEDVEHDVLSESRYIIDADESTS